MNRRDALRVTGVVGLASLGGTSLVRALLRAGSLHRITSQRMQMGTPVHLTLLHPDPAAAREIVDQTFATIDGLEDVFSRHRPESVLSRLNATGRLDHPPVELVRVLRCARDIHEASGGAFDITAGPLVELYGRVYRDTGRGPTAAAVRHTRDRVGFERVQFDEDHVSLEGGVTLTFDGIAKGFIVDQSVGFLLRQGMERVMVDAGGDVGTAGPRGEWTLGVQHPRSTGLVATLRGGSGGCATSGDYVEFFADDRSAHHIIDPRTGRSPDELSAVTVQAHDLMHADALSTACMVTGIDAGRDLLRTFQAAGLFIRKDGTILRTTGFAPG